MDAFSRAHFVALALVLSSLGALAQGSRSHPPNPPVVAALDVNGDGTISSTEIADAPEALKTLDANGDGQLSAEEIRPAPPNAAIGNAGGPPPPRAGGGPNMGQPPRLPILNALDADGDGTLSAQEISHAPAALLTLGKNGDGQLTRDEIMPPPPSGRQGPGGPPGPPSAPSGD